MLTPAFFKRRNIVAWLVLLTLGLHGLIPVGYMPDMSGQGWLVLCDGTDHMAMPGHEGHAGHHHDGHHHTGTCPFAAGAVYGILSIRTPQIAPPVYITETLRLQALLTRARLADFSNASPRSPPHLS